MTTPIATLRHATFSRRPFLGILLAIVTGVALGVLSRAQWDWLGNVSWPWLLLAFLAGSVAEAAWLGSLVGLLALLTAVASYYVWMFFVDYQMPLAHFLTYGIPDFVVKWTVVAVICGPIFGAAGAIWRRGGRLRIAAVALLMGALAGSSIGELLLNWANHSMLTFGLICAVLLPWLLLRPRDRASAFVLAGGFAMLGVFAFALLVVSLRTFAR